MSDSDDYDFSPGKSTSLSFIFKREQDLHEEPSDLTYKSPKQPSVVPKDKNIVKEPPKFLFKYIELDNITDDIKLGKHILGLLYHEHESGEMLIYQNKKNILIRQAVSDTVLILSNCEEFALILETRGTTWLLRHESNECFKEFCEDFIKLGGHIKSLNNSKKNANAKAMGPETLNDSDEQSTSKSVEIDELNLNQKSSEIDVKKEDILARLSRMGLPQLPIHHQNLNENRVICKSSTSIENVRIDECKMQMVEIPNNAISVKKEIQSDHVDRSQLIDSLALLISENFRNNLEMNQRMNYNSRNVNENEETNRMKSKLKAVQIKAENLEDELEKLKNKFQQLQRVNEDLRQKLDEKRSNDAEIPSQICDSLTQTHKINNIDEEMMKELCNFVENLPPFSEVDLGPLYVITDNKECDCDLKSMLDKSGSILQNRIDSQSENLEKHYSDIRGNFIKTTRKFMNELYSNICTNFSDNDHIRNEIAVCIRQATNKIIENYENSIENDLKKYTH